MNPWIIEITRGQCVESSSVGHGVVVDADGTELVTFGEKKRETFPRSAAKWIQALELVLSGAADELGLRDDHLAIACASHNGEPEHITLVNAWLGQLGLITEDLECGVSLPFTEPVRLQLSHDHIPATQLHHCCSGKHVAMLAVCKQKGWSTNGYTDYKHPLQAKIRQHMTTIFGVDANSLDYATDGCSVPTYLLPLDVMALGFAKLGAGHFSTKLNHAATRLRYAQASAPFMVAGSERLDSQLLIAGQGRLQVKMGAEGVYLGAIPDRKIGFAIKCEDGSLRGQEALVIELLRTIGEENLINRLPLAVSRPVVRTAKGLPVGQVVVRKIT
ncbi:MAG: asparaginase [Gammaproteobacteria bacterium]|nr:asparaginase [Gammaproteobacteria bacterium]|tara:strand:+ start:3520 stop:4512 length:993 start_codon:yes stop_codon:yes gene_type:complete